MKTFVYLICSFNVLISAAESNQPNIIFVLADDLGWAELGCYGNSFNETPHLDKLASEGTRFTHAYAAAPVCSPYRAAFLTGKHPARVGITDYLRPNSSNGLSPEHHTITESLKEQGYTTGMVGKWHLTGYQHHDAEFELRPADHGFDWNIGSEVKGVGNGANFWPYRFRTQPILWLNFEKPLLGEKEYLTDRLNAEALSFIDKYKDQPFFLYLSHYAPHTILNGRPDLVEKYKKKHPPGKSGRENCYICEDAGLGKGDPGHHWAVDHNPHLAAMLESIDDGIGKISDKLEQLGIAENTILIFTSDNGGETNVTSNAPLRGGKSQLYEGGIRVPMIVRWPAQLAKGTVSDLVTQNVDFYPTLLEAAGSKPPEDATLDGVSTLEAWKDPAKHVDRDFIAWHYPLDRPHFLGGTSGGAIRNSEWKLVEHFTTGKDELFSVAKDPSEANDVAGENPQVVAELKAKLNTWREQVGARIPSPTLLTDTRDLYFGDHFHPEMVSERLWYNKDWVAEDGILKRLPGKENTRIFLRDAEYKDVVVRFDFRIGEAKDIRLMTGANGGYNTVINIRPDHFYIQTAVDRSVPYFSYRHGECAYHFEPDRWYTMTVEFINDEVIAHIDADHVAHAKHPMIDRTRSYFALQVDEQAAQFDNIQIFKAAGKKGEDQQAGRNHLETVIDKYPVNKSLQEQYKIRSSNAHEWYYQNDENYRTLVKRVDELDEQNKSQFPAVHQSAKDIRKKISEQRKHLLKNDPDFRETLFATHRANRAIDTYLIEKKPEIADWPRSKKEAEMERLKKQFAADSGYRDLISQSKAAMQKLEADYPQLFVSDEAIKAKKQAAQEKAKNDPAFKKAKQDRADAHKAQQQYLLEKDQELADLQKRLDSIKSTIQ